jgi:hypothetical protein
MPQSCHGIPYDYYLLLLLVVLSLKSKQAWTIQLSFVQLLLDDDEQVFVEMPRGFREERKVLRLKRTLYGLKQSPRTWFTHLKSNF